jgi:hypothetical protein
VPVAHACNPSYSGSRDHKGRSSKPAQPNSSWGPIFKKPFTKKVLVEWLKVKALSSNLSTTRKKTNKQTKDKPSNHRRTKKTIAIDLLI